jgi:hypothetical protein
LWTSWGHGRIRCAIDDSETVASPDAPNRRCAHARKFHDPCRRWILRNIRTWRCCSRGSTLKQPPCWAALSLTIRLSATHRCGRTYGVHGAPVWRNSRRAVPLGPAGAGRSPRWAVGAAAIIEQVERPSSSAETVIHGLTLIPDLIRAARRMRPLPRDFNPRYAAAQSSRRAAHLPQRNRGRARSSASPFRRRPARLSLNGVSSRVDAASLKSVARARCWRSPQQVCKQDQAAWRFGVICSCGMPSSNSCPS